MEEHNLVEDNFVEEDNSLGLHKLVEEEQGPKIEAVSKILNKLLQLSCITNSIHSPYHHKTVEQTFDTLNNWVQKQNQLMVVGKL